MSLLILFSAFTSSQPATLLADDADNDDNPSSDEIMSQQMSELVAGVRNDPQKSSVDDLYGNVLAEDSDGDTLVGSGFESKARTTRPQTICYGDIDLF
jgi:hypothetical protein